MKVMHLLQKVTSNSQDQPCLDWHLFVTYGTKESTENRNVYECVLKINTNISYGQKRQPFLWKGGKKWPKCSLYRIKIIIIIKKQHGGKIKNKHLHSVSPKRDAKKWLCFHGKHGILFVFFTAADPVRDANTDCAAHNYQALHFRG